MMQRVNNRILLIAASLLSFLLLAATPVPAAQDVMVVIDLPDASQEQQAMESTLQQFVGELPDDTHVGVVNASGTLPVLVADLMPASALVAALVKLQPGTPDRAQKDPAVAFERALYALRIAGRAEAAKHIVLVSDGRVVLADTEKQTEHNRWWRGALMEEAGRHRVRVYPVAWSAEADIAFMQSMAAATGGEYYRAETADSLPLALSRLAAVIHAQVPPAAPAATTGPPPTPVDTAVALPDTASDRLAGWVLAAVVGAGVLLSAIATVLVVRRSRPGKEDVSGGKAAQPISSHAYLNDLNATTAISRYVIGPKPVVIGRTTGRDTRQFDYITVPLKTVGRRHALITYKDGGYWITDSGSINGTHVNNQRITAVQRLHDGDRIRVHHCEFQFELPGDEPDDSTLTETAARPVVPPPATPVTVAPHAATAVHASTATVVTHGGDVVPVTDTVKIAASKPAPLEASAQAPAPASSTVAAASAQHSGDTMILSLINKMPMQEPVSSVTVEVSNATTPTADPRSLQSFISTSLLHPQQPDSKEASSTAESNPVTPRKPIQLLPRTEDVSVREMSIEDFMKEGEVSQDPFWLSTAQMASSTTPPAAAALTEPLADKLAAASVDEEHMGDTLNIWTDTDPAQQAAPTESLEDKLAAVPTDAEHMGDTLNIWTGADPAQQAAPTESLEDKLAAASVDEEHMGDTLNIWADTDPAAQTAPTESLEEHLGDTGHWFDIDDITDNDADKKDKPRDKP